MGDFQRVMRQLNSAHNVPTTMDPRRIQAPKTSVVEYTHACGGLFLPLGVYYSEVDGSIIRVTADEFQHDPVVVEFDLKLSMKCHSRVVKNSLKLFHLLRRKFQKDYGKRAMRVQEFIIRKMKKIIPRIRTNLMIKKVIRIQ